MLTWRGEKVLACSIVVVFCAGLVKLWHTNRLLRKHMVLDEEKLARQREMRKSGLPVGRKADIPFGVRAIQTGIEVDGIWISRPGTPDESSEDLGASTLIGSVSASDVKGKDKDVRPSPSSAVAAGLRKPTTAVVEVEPTPNQSPAPSLLERSGDAYTSSPLRMSQLGVSQHSTYRPTQTPHRPLAATATARAASSDASRSASSQQFESAARTPRLETYVPTSPHSGERNTAYTPMRRRSESFDDSPEYDDEGGGDDDYTYGDAATPTARYQDRPPVLQPLTRRPGFYDDPEISPPTPTAAAADFAQRDAYLSTTTADPAQPEYRRDNLLDGSSGRDSLTLGHGHGHRVHASYGSTTDSRGAGAPPPSAPQRSYSGDTHVNTSSRRVNAGFEVLPAGTFSTHHHRGSSGGGSGRPRSQGDAESTYSNRSRNRIPPVTNRLQKKGHH